MRIGRKGREDEESGSKGWAGFGGHAGDHAAVRLQRTSQVLRQSPGPVQPARPAGELHGAEQPDQ